MRQGILSSPCNEWRGYTLQPPDKVSLACRCSPEKKWQSQPQNGSFKQTHPKCELRVVSRSAYERSCTRMADINDAGELMSTWDVILLFPVELAPRLPFKIYFKPINYARSTGQTRSRQALLRFSASVFGACMASRSAFDSKPSVSQHPRLKSH